MADNLKLIFMTFIITMTLVAATPIERERRFLVDTIVSGTSAIKEGVTQTFFKVFGIKFHVKDASKTLSAADALRSYGHTVSDMGVWYAEAAEGYRRSMYHEDAYRYLNQWESAARLLTQLGDEMVFNQKNLISYNTWIRLAVTANSGDPRVKDLYRTALEKIGAAIDRVEGLLPSTKLALTALRAVAGDFATEDIDKTLKKVANTNSLMLRARAQYDTLEKALGLDD